MPTAAVHFASSVRVYERIHRLVRKYDASEVIGLQSSDPSTLSAGEVSAASMRQSCAHNQLGTTYYDEWRLIDDHCALL